MDTKGNILDKVQKLTNALYRVTDLLSDREPLKWALRNKAIKIYNNLLSLLLPEQEIKDKNNIINEIINSLSQIINLLDFASNGSSVSSINFKILSKEYSNLKSFVDGKRGDITQEQKLLIDFNEKTENKQNNKKESIGHSIGRGNNLNNMERKNRILDCLKNKGPKTISEIKTDFPETGEKTIQRDLIKMTQMGKIRADGERRWRKYYYIETQAL
jgi:hypothetical protein